MGRIAVYTSKKSLFYKVALLILTDLGAVFSIINVSKCVISVQAAGSVPHPPGAP